MRAFIRPDSQPPDWQVFELLSRLRQTVDHPYLVIHGASDEHRESLPTTSTMPGGSDVCGICMQVRAFQSVLSTIPCVNGGRRVFVCEREGERMERSE